jgi:hypothetical protein
MVGDWVIFMEPVEARRKGYHAVARSSGLRLIRATPTVLSIRGSG